MRFSEIKRFPQIYYRVTIPLDYIEEILSRWTKEHDLNLEPDFQRGHVWTKKQKIAYVEYVLKNPSSGLEIYFNHPQWMGTWKGEFVIVDGKQRLNAILSFLRNEIPVYGAYYKQYKDRLPTAQGLFFNIATLKTKKEVLQWYLDFNAGGTPHSAEEINRVRKLIDLTP